MKRHLILVYWLLLLVSTLAIGGVAFYLLQRESVRLRQAAADSVVDTGQKMAASLESLVQDTKSDSMDALAKLPNGSNTLFNLLNWKNTNPYARSVFYYEPASDLLILPSEDRDSIAPYLHQPNGDWIWGSSGNFAQAHVFIASFTAHSGPPGDNRGHGPGGPRSDAATNNYSQMKADRQQIRQATKGSVNSNPDANPKSVVMPGNSINGAVGSNANSLNVNGNGLEENVGGNLTVSATDSVPGMPKVNALPTDVLVTQFEGNLVLNSGMTPDQAQWVISQQTFEIISGNIAPPPAKPEQGWAQIGPPNKTRWLGWMRPSSTSPVRGMILSWQALTKPFANALNGRIDPAAGYILRNPAGEAIAAHFANAKLLQGADESTALDSPTVKPAQAYLTKLNLDATAMPGWVLEVYYNASSAFTSGFMTVSTILVTLLVIFVLIGGTLLLREARREAFEAARKTNFVSNVSHELKTPLTTIRMYAELLGEGRVRDQARQHNYLSTIIGESQRLTRLVNNVLDFSRLEQGRKQYHPDDLALATVIENVIEAQRPRLEEAGFEIETEFPYGRDVRIHADRDALEQVLINLIDNAMKYAASGRWLGIRVSVEGEHANISVSDHGPGVPAAHQERIFEMFHRVDNSITSKLPGAGLGLSIARRLLRDQEGDLLYVPNEPHGSTFVASLPLASVISAAKIE